MLMKYLFNPYTLNKNNPNIIPNSNHVAFKAKPSEETAEKTDDNGLKSASDAISSIGIANISMSQKEKREYIASLTKEDIQSRVDSGMSAAQIQKDLKISAGTYQKLLHKFEIKTSQLSANETCRNITKEDITTRLNKNMGSIEICKDLSISHSTFIAKCREFGIQTKHLEAKEKLASISKEQLTDAIERLKSRKAVCAELGITEKQYVSLCNKYGIKTEAALIKERAAAITEEQLKDLLIEQKKTRSIAAKELGVSVTTIDRLIAKFRLPIKSELENKQEIIAKISVEQLKEPENSDLTIKEKAKALNIGVNTYLNLLYKMGLKQLTQEELALKSRIETLLAQNKTMKDIANELNISYFSLHNFIDKFSITTPKKEIHSNISSIDKEKFTKMVKLGFSKSDIKEEFNISENTYYNMIYKLNLSTTLNSSKNDINDVSKEKFLELINKNCSRSEICMRLNISKYMYRRLLSKYGIITPQTAINEHVNSITKEELSLLVEQGYKKETICEMLDISSGSYTKLMKKFKIPNRKIQERKNIAQISQKELEALLDKMRPYAASKVLNISTASVYRIMLKFKIHPSQTQIPQGKDYENFSEEELKNKLLETMPKNLDPEKEHVFEDIIYFALGQKFTDENKTLIVNLIKLLEKINNNSISIKDSLNNNTVNEFYLLMQQDAETKQKQEDYLKYLQQRIQEEISQSSNKELSNILNKYIPHSAEDESLSKAEYILNTIDKCDDIPIAVKILTYWEAKNNQDEILPYAEKFASVNEGSIDETKAGKYILSVQRFMEITNDESDENYREYVNIIKSKLIDKGNNNYPKAVELLEIYNNISDTFKPLLLNEAKQHNKCNSKTFSNTIKQLEEKIKFCDIDNVSIIEFYHPRSGKMIKCAILPKAKYECWQYCVEHYNQNAFKRFYDFMDKFYESASKWAKQEFGSSGIKSITNKKSVFNEIKIKGGQEFSDWRLYSTSANSSLYDSCLKDIDKEFIFDTFNNHEWLTNQD